jgi:hypothetical protein
MKSENCTAGHPRHMKSKTGPTPTQNFADRGKPIAIGRRRVMTLRDFTEEDIAAIETAEIPAEAYLYNDERE